MADLELYNLANAELLLPCKYTEALWVESNVGTQVTPCTEDGQTCGMAVDFSPNYHRVVALTDAGRPLYSTSGTSGMHCIWQFSTTKYFNIENSQGYFNFLHSGTSGTPGVPVGCIAFHTKINTDSTNMVFLDNSAWTGVNKGITVARTSGNKLQVAIANGSTLQNITTAANLNAAAGLVPIIINFLGTTGAGSCNIYIGGATESFSVSSTGLAFNTNSTNTLYIGGASPSATSPLNAYMGNLCILSQPMGASDRAAFAAMNPYQNATTTSRSLMAGDAVDPSAMSHLWCDWNLDDFAGGTLWQNIGRTTPVAANGDPIGAVDFLPTKLGRGLAAAADNTTRPTWTSNQYNGKGCGRWIGTATPQNLAYTPWKPYGAETVFVVARNTNTTNGSHFLASASARFLATGDSYSGNPVGAGGPGTAFFALHPAAGLAPFMNLGNLGQSVNIQAYRRRGPKIQIYVNGVLGSVAGNTNALAFANMGTPQIANWDVQGDIVRVVRFVTDLSDQDFDRVMHGLANRYAVPGVTYPNTVNKIRFFGGWRGGYNG